MKLSKDMMDKVDDEVAEKATELYMRRKEIELCGEHRAALKAEMLDLHLKGLCVGQAMDAVKKGMGSAIPDILKELLGEAGLDVEVIKLG